MEEERKEKQIETTETAKEIPAEPVVIPNGAPEQYEVVSVRFRTAGKSYYFAPCGKQFKMGDQVVVETASSSEFGVVTAPNKIVSAKEVVLPLRKVLRVASERDIRRREDNRALELRARKIWQEKVEQHKLEMALSDVECAFDNSKIIFYFTAEGRVDFREFVKDMAGVFKTRIELRQIGVRDEAKQLGGLGICGRPLCCASFLNDFQQVSIKMAKEQNLSLNSAKISGTCGRLMCCLRYENDAYVECGKKCPKAGNCVMTPDGKGSVTDANVLCGRCRVRLEEEPDSIREYAAEDLKVIPKVKKPQQPQQQNGEKKKSNPRKDSEKKNPAPAGENGAAEPAPADPTGNGAFSEQN
ncbi:MAG: stage 0 sporulation family protein [Clostridia bacterium]|nr:stage 0 sporulation family protein [Clostridia bacterium]